MSTKTEMKSLFESKKRVTAIGAPDAKITFTKDPFIQYEQFLLDKLSKNSASKNMRNFCR